MAEQGLCFLRNLSVAEANRVSWWACLGHPWYTSLRPRSHACPVRPAPVRCCVQVPLMVALPCAQAAMDAHRGVAAVAEQGLALLCKLVVAEASQVSWWATLPVCHWACFGQPWCTLLCRCSHACPVHPALVRCCVQGSLVAAVWLAISALSVLRLFQDSGRVQYSPQLSAAFRCRERLCFYA